MPAEEKARVSITGDTAGLTRALGVATRAVGRFASGTAKRVSASLGNVGGQLTAIGGLATVGGFAVFANSALEFEEQLTRIEIQSGATASETDVLRQSVTDASVAFGQGRKEILNGLAALVDLQGASAATPSNIRLIGKAMTATGAEARDLAGVIFSLQDTFGLDSSQIEAALSGVTAAGKAASIPLAELATTLQQQAANLVGLTGKGLQGVARTNAILQTLRKGFGSATEAGTGAKAIGTAFTANAAKLREYGVQIFRLEKGRKVFRDFREILVQIGNSRLARDPTALQKALGSSEAATAVNVLRENLGVFDQLVEAGKDYNTLQRDANKFLSSAAGRQQAAITKLKASIESTFTPEVIETFSLALESSVKIAGSLLDRFVQIAEVTPGIRHAAEALSEVLADATGLTDKQELIAAAPQLLAEQAQRFGAGESLRLGQGAFARASTKTEAARSVVRSAEREGLVNEGKVNPAVATRAFLAAQGATPQNATPAQRDLATTRLRGVERALQLLAQDRQRNQPIDVRVDVRVDGDGTARAAVRQARSG